MRRDPNITFAADERYAVGVMSTEWRRVSK